MKRVLLILALLGFCTTSTASEQNAKDYIYQSLECSSYFFIAAGGLKKPGNTFNPALAATYDKHAGWLMMFGRIVGNGIDMKQETLDLIMEQSFTRLQGVMGYNYSNFALLQNQYGETCKEFAEAAFTEMQAKGLIE